MKSVFAAHLVLSLALLCACSTADTRADPLPDQVAGQPNQSHEVPHGRQRHPHLRNANGTSNNWSGYAAYSSPSNNSVTDVKGAWVVPAVTGTGTQLCSAWVGIDGYGSGTVEQIGTESDWYNGAPTYNAWYEMYPESETRITTMTVYPGDQMTAEVQYTAGGFVMTIFDLTQSSSFSITRSSLPLHPANRVSAEWIVEAPTLGGNLAALAYFGLVNFNACSATINGVTGTISNSAWTNVPITMQSTGGTTQAVPSALSPDGAAFSVTDVMISYPLSVFACPASGGLVAVSPNLSSYYYGTVLSISETAKPGYAFAGWTATGGTLSNSAAPTATLTITGNSTLMANFIPTCSGIETAVGGSIVLSSSGPYYLGSQLTATAAANPGFIFTGWTVSGGSLTSSSALTTTLTVLDNFTLTANFSAATLTVSATLDNSWVYQNAPLTTRNRLCRTLTITVSQDSWPDQNFTVQVSTAGAGALLPTSSFVFTGSAAALYLFGGPRQADGVTGTGSCVVTLLVTGDQSGPLNAFPVQTTLMVRRLGDAIGDGTVTPADRVQLMKWLNSVPTPNQTLANFDFDGDGAVTLNDLAILNTLLNNLSVP